METASQTIAPKTNYLNADYCVKSWLLTTDHKRIALLYLMSITLFFFLGGFFAMLIRLELLTPAGDLVLADTYNKLFTMHGIVMIFLFLIPSVPAVFGNFLVPMMIGAKDLAFPRLNLLSWYLYMGGATLIVYAIITGGVDTGWTFYTPYSTTYSNTNVVTAALGVFVVGFSSIFTGLNIIVTVHRMRAPGLTWRRLPLFIWANYAASVIMVLGTPVLAITLVLVALERVFHIGIFDARLGGDPILFQHLFWFYSHPAVYIMILPGMGVVSEVIACFSRKRPFGYDYIAMSSIAIAVLGFLVWAHHMFVAGISVYAAIIFSLLSFFVAIPSAVKVFNWTATLYKGSITFETPMLYMFAFIGLFTIGGLTGVFLPLGSIVHVHRHLLCGGALPLRNGGRHGHGVHGRAAFLVAEDDRQDVSGIVRQVERRAGLRRLQSHFLSAVSAGLHGHAAPLPRLSAGVSGAQRAVDRGRLDSGGGLPHADDLFRLEPAIWQGCGTESLSRRRTGMDDRFSAADI